MPKGSTKESHVSAVTLDGGGSALQTETSYPYLAIRTAYVSLVEGSRPSIFAFTTGTGAGGFVDVDWVRYRKVDVAA
jgi:hypothetical protein